jgi:hypothetical protein
MGIVAAVPALAPHRDRSGYPPTSKKNVGAQACCAHFKGRDLPSPGYGTAGKIAPLPASDEIMFQSGYRTASDSDAPDLLAALLGSANLGQCQEPGP